MAYWNIDTSSTGVGGVVTGVDNDLGTIRGGGNVSDTNLFRADAISLGLSRQVTVVSGVNANQAINASGIFNGQGQVIRLVGTGLAGTYNNSVSSPSSDAANRPYSINRLQSSFNYNYGSAIVSGAWHELSGTFTSAVSVINTGVVRTSGDEAALMKDQDDAANPSASIPGELVFRDGSPLPTFADYAAKTSF
jgi:hypothetical protein